MVTNPDNGSIVSSEIYRSTIVVKRRYTYEDVAAMFLSGTPTEAMAYLHHLTELRSSVLNYRLALPSLRFRVDLSGVVTSIISEDTNDAAHSLVATAMIMANLVVSLLLKENGIPNRFHASPLRGIPPVATTTGNRAVDSYLRVKRYARASYDVDERGHFGLGLTDYVHFTSPMRRYADVVIHRILSGVFYVDLDAEVSAMNRSVSRDLQEIYQSWKIVRHLSSLSSHAQHVVYVVGIKERGGVYWFMPSLSLDGFTHLSRMMPPQFWGSSDSELVGARVTVRMGNAFYATVESVDSVTSRVMLQIHTDRPAP
jgi:ribonuclease R